MGQPEMELFSHGRKPRSNYRRPSSLGMANTPLPDQSEAKGSFTPLSGGRSHIVAPLRDHLRPEGNFEKSTEMSAYRNLSPSRPVIHKLKDHGVDVQPEGNISKTSEYNTNFAKSMKGERAPPAWLSDFEKVTIE